MPFSELRMKQEFNERGKVNIAEIFWCFGNNRLMNRFDSKIMKKPLTIPMILLTISILYCVNSDNTMVQIKAEYPLFRISSQKLKSMQ